MAKKMSKVQIKKAKRMAEKMKGKEGIDNPHALARWQVKQSAKKKAKVKIKKGAY